MVAKLIRPIRTQKLGIGDDVDGTVAAIPEDLGVVSRLASSQAFSSAVPFVPTTKIKPIAKRFLERALAIGAFVGRLAPVIAAAVHFVA